MTSKPPFDLLRASFALIAAVVAIELAVTAIGMVSCFWLILTGRGELGGCVAASDRAREVFSELLTAVLALLLAGRKPPE